MKNTLLLSRLVLIGCAWGCGQDAMICPVSYHGSGRPDGGTDGGWSQPPDASESERTSPLGCTLDLHSRIDPSGTAIACAPDQGCLEGVCVPACRAVASIRGSLGCDFFVARPPLATYPTSCHAVLVANNWSKPASIEVSRAELSYPLEKFARVAASGCCEPAWPAVPPEGLPTQEVAVLFLENGPEQARGCPVEAALDMSTTIERTGRGRAWHIVTDTPVSIYDVFPYGAANSKLPSASLVLPTSAWGAGYIAVVPMFRISTRNIPIPSSQWAQILAAENDTIVEILTQVDLPAASGVTAAPRGIPTRYILSAGEVIQWYPRDGKPMELTGAIISSNRPVGFVGGNDYLCIESSTSHGGGCDSAHQQIPPAKSLAERYVVAPHPSRLATGESESSWYRIVAAANDTALVFDPPVSGGPSTLQRGEWRDFQAVGAFELSSQDSAHPFYLAQTMAGSDVTVARRSDLGDEEFVNVIPPSQFLSSYVFYTDATYSTTTLVLTQCDSGQGYGDVEVDCAGTVSGWSPIGSGGRCRWATVALVEGGSGVGACHNGTHAASSTMPFALTVWGLAPYASYAYPAGAGALPLNTVLDQSNRQ